MTKAALKDKPEDLVFINNLALIFYIIFKKLLIKW